MKRILFVASTLALFFTVLQTNASSGTSLQMQLGNPSNATTDTNNHDHYLIQRTVEAIDYSDHFGEPNWASWDLTGSDIGSSGRSPSFYTDTNLPSNFYLVTTDDYTYSGYDRGHMCPSYDRTDDSTNNKLVFFMSNIIPQTPDNNQGVWQNLESYCQSLAQSGYELLIICGPNGFSGARINTNGPVFIPDYTWKIAVVVTSGAGTALDRITTSTRVIAVNIPNIAGIRTAPWTNYLVSVNMLQTNTGYTFFTALPANVATVLRAKIDGYPTPGIISFTPTNGAAGTTVTINGTNFNSASTVWFNGSGASFTVNSGAQITATVPSSATTGPIAVIAPGGLATSTNNFTVQGTNLSIQSFGFAAGHFNMTISGASGKNYTVMTTTNLANPDWVAVFSTNATAMPFTFTDTNTALAQRFYRVLEQ